MKTSTREVVRLFNERSAFWSQQGFSGAALFRQLALDDALPLLLDPEVVATVEGVSTGALKKHRSRRTGLPYVKGERVVRYTRQGLCEDLARRFTPPGAKPATAAPEPAGQPPAAAPVPEPAPGPEPAGEAPVRPRRSSIYAPVAKAIAKPAKPKRSPPVPGRPRGRPRRQPVEQR